MRKPTWLVHTLVLTALTATGCQGRLAYNTPPAQQMMHPGPGVGGPGPGVIPVGTQMTMPGAAPNSIGPGGSSVVPCGGSPSGGCPSGSCSAMGNTPSGIQPCQYCEGGVGGYGGAGGMAGMGATSQIAFLGEEGLQVSWDVSGSGLFGSTPLVVPGRQDFPQGAIYRLKLTNLPGREAVSLYPTLEIAPVTPRTDAYLAHAPIPVQFTEEDFDQVISGNFVTKVIYLPDPEFQELALAGVETLVSTRLDPGCDPVSEADRRGSILAILRIGNKDLESTSRGHHSGVVLPAQYDEAGQEIPAPTDYYADSSEARGYDESYSGPTYQEGPVYDGGAMSGAPRGAPTAGFAPSAVPPHQVPMMAAQWGHPITGTPIGLPGPPHIPLGVPAGLRSHVMKNRTRVNLPPPTNKMTISVKQRPGMNYPAPVNRIHIDETHRAPTKCIHGTVPNLCVECLRGAARAVGQAHASDCDCNQCR